MQPPLAAETLDITFETDALTTLVRLFERHGDAFRAHSPALGRDIWVLSHPDHVRHVLVDHHANFTKGIGIERVAILLGNGIMTSEGDAVAHAAQADPAGVPPQGRRDVDAAHPCGDRSGSRSEWQRRRRRAASPVNVTQDMSEATLEVVLRALFGDDLARLEAARRRQPVRAPHRPHRAQPRVRVQVPAAREAHHGRTSSAAAATTCARDDIVSLLIDARDRADAASRCPDRQLLDEIMTLIIAGHETTASSLNWFWYLLTQTPDVAARAPAEADAARRRRARLRGARAITPTPGARSTRRCACIRPAGC